MQMYMTDWIVGWVLITRSDFKQDDGYLAYDSLDAPPSDSGYGPPSDNNPPSDLNAGGSPAAAGGATGNPIDDCWRHDPNWANNRQALASCAIGFGKNAIGGAQGPIYVVTDDSDDDLVNPKEGTLRYGVLQDVRHLLSLINISYFT